ncbi:MAG: hypothetical protein CM1200mP34_0600 [Verrucomicrobiales bacterium]|nr:MAG: hypothetical protein CM1200mP34_0600 [Verrucomicrobiales bacterium]
MRRWRRSRPSMGDRSASRFSTSGPGGDRGPHSKLERKEHRPLVSSSGSSCSNGRLPGVGALAAGAVPRQPDAEQPVRCRQLDPPGLSGRGEVRYGAGDAIERVPKNARQAEHSWWLWKRTFPGLPVRTVSTPGAFVNKTPRALADSRPSRSRPSPQEPARSGWFESCRRSPVRPAGKTSARRGRRPPKAAGIIQLRRGAAAQLPAPLVVVPRLGEFALQGTHPEPGPPNAPRRSRGRLRGPAVGRKRIVGVAGVLWARSRDMGGFRLFRGCGDCFFGRRRWPRRCG